MRKVTAKPVYMYDMWGDLFMEFKTTKECAEYCEKEPEYINYNIKYCNKIRVDGIWFKLRRNKM